MYTTPAVRLNSVPKMIPDATGALCIIFIGAAREKTFTMGNCENFLEVTGNSEFFGFARPSPRDPADTIPFFT
jgi:hypothetical protein